MLTLTYKAKCLARLMLNRGAQIEEVVATFHGRYTAEDIAAGVAALRANAKKNRAPAIGWKNIAAVHTALTIPDHVLTERERRKALSPRDITAAQMGDPLPGYSAAERAPSITPSIHRDPLDALMFGRRAMHSETSDRVTAEK